MKKATATYIASPSHHPRTVLIHPRAPPQRQCFLGVNGSPNPRCRLLVAHALLAVSGTGDVRVGDVDDRMYTVGE